MADEIGESGLAGMRLLRVGGRAKWALVTEGFGWISSGGPGWISLGGR